MRPVVECRASREMSSGRDRWSDECDKWPLGSVLSVPSLSSCYISPVCVVWRLSGEGGMICVCGQSVEDQGRTTDDWTVLTSSDTFPDVYTFSLRIPNTALRVEIPVDVDFPDSGGVADYSGHR